MERFKIKNWIFIFFLSVLMFFSLNFIKIKAVSSDYNVEIKSISNIRYGDKLKNAEIVVKSQDIEGTIHFSNPELIVDKVGKIDVELIFVPNDLNNYASKVINFNAFSERREIYISFLTPIYKQYDGTDDVIFPEYKFEGILNDEVTIEGNLIGKYSAIYPNDGVEINLSGVELSGDKKDNYKLRLNGYTGRIHPNVLNDFSNLINIELQKDVCIDNNYKLTLKKVDSKRAVNGKYTSFKDYLIILNNHSGEEIKLDSKYKVTMKVDKEFMNKERLEVFSLDKNGNYNKLNYTYNDGVMNFEIDNGSSIIFTTRNIEYSLIITFSLILLFSLGFGVIYRIKNSRI